MPPTAALALLSEQLEFGLEPRVVRGTLAARSRLKDHAWAAIAFDGRIAFNWAPMPRLCWPVGLFSNTGCPAASCMEAMTSIDGLHDNNGINDLSSGAGLHDDNGINGLCSGAVWASVPLVHGAGRPSSLLEMTRPLAGRPRG